MKKLTSVLSLCLLLSYPLQALPAESVGKPRPENTLATLLSRYVTYPATLRQLNHGGIIVLSFQVDTNNRLKAVQAHTQNETLNADLGKQLTGKKLYQAGLAHDKMYTLRLHFCLAK